jgi:large subunit ribosomal protein L4
MPATKTTKTTKTTTTTRRKKAEEATEAKPLQVPFFDALGERNGDVDLPEAIFAEQPNVPVMHQAYLRQLANARQGNASTKTRGDVSGGGAKPYRQKGTGRARHGSIREPSMKGGGNVFGPRPRDFSQRMPKPKTSQAAELLETIGFDSTALVVLPAPNYTVSRSFENLAGAKIVLARNLNVRDLFSHTYLLLAKDSIELLEENFSKREEGEVR